MSRGSVTVKVVVGLGSPTTQESRQASALLLVTAVSRPLKAQQRAIQARLAHTLPHVVKALSPLRRRHQVKRQPSLVLGQRNARHIVHRLHRVLCGKLLHQAGLWQLQRHAACCVTLRPRSEPRLRLSNKIGSAWSCLTFRLLYGLAACNEAAPCE